MFAVCLQITIQLSQGRVIPVIAPPGEESQTFNHCLFLSLDVYTLPPTLPSALDNFVFVPGISILSPGFVTLIGNRKDLYLTYLWDVKGPCRHSWFLRQSCMGPSH